MARRTEERVFLCDEPWPRVDKFCSHEGLQRSLFSRDDTIVTVNGKRARKSRSLEKGDEVRVTYVVDDFPGLIAEDIPLDVLYEDEAMLVINKKAGMVVHPAVGNWDGTLVNAILGRWGEEMEVSDSLRPGIVHRLDKDTSGTMVIARTKEAEENLARQFREHETRKIYLAVAEGLFREKEGDIVTYIGRNPADRKRFRVCDEGEGKIARTAFRVLKQYPTCALVRLRIFTGRTHQIRVHLASLGHAVVGDPLYGREEPGGMLLHAFSLTLRHPVSGREMTFRSPLPDRFRAYLIPLRARGTVSSQSSAT